MSPQECLNHSYLTPVRFLESHHLALGTGFVEDNFSMEQGGGDGFRMIQAHYNLLCTLLLLLWSQLYLRSLGIRSWRLTTSELEYSFSKTMLSLRNKKACITTAQNGNY